MLLQAQLPMNNNELCHFSFYIDTELKEKIISYFESYKLEHLNRSDQIKNHF